MTTITITDDNGNTATAETIGKAKRALAKIAKAERDAENVKAESARRASDMAYRHIGELAVHAGPKSWGARSEVLVRGSSGFAIYVGAPHEDSTGGRIQMDAGQSITLARFGFAVDAIYTSPGGNVMAVHATPKDSRLAPHWRAVGADGETFDSVEIPAGIVALFPAPTVDELAPAAPATEGR